jgi:hypothetical protein
MSPQKQMRSGNVDSANMERKQVFFYQKEMTTAVLHLISNMSVVMVIV